MNYEFKLISFTVFYLSFPIISTRDVMSPLRHHSTGHIFSLEHKRGIRITEEDENYVLPFPVI